MNQRPKQPSDESATMYQVKELGDPQNILDILVIPETVVTFLTKEQVASPVVEHLAMRFCYNEPMPPR